jgi:hypothetical protein
VDKPLYNSRLAAPAAIPYAELTGNPLNIRVVRSWGIRENLIPCGTSQVGSPSSLYDLEQIATLGGRHHDPK